MNMAETLRGLWRRWYILVPGLVLAVALAVGAWVVVKPTYTRSATELLIPSSGSYAPYTGNPFLNLEGLTGAADVLVGSLGADDVAGKLMDEYPGTKVIVARDPLNSGPALLFQVTASSDAESEEVLHRIVGETQPVLDDLQDAESIASEFRVKAISITFDAASKVDQKSRITVTVLVGIGVAILTILLTALVDGLTRRRLRAETESRVRVSTPSEPERKRPRRRWRVSQP